MHVHLVFVTKFRHKVFADRHLTRMEQIMRDVCADFEAELVEFNGENNHVRLWVNFPFQRGPSPRPEGPSTDPHSSSECAARSSRPCWCQAPGGADRIPGRGVQRG